MADSSSVDKLTIDRQKVLGMGNYGSVFEGIWGGIKVAVKRILVENVARDKTTKIEREGNALNKLDHENVIKLFDVEENIDFKIFVLELCDASLEKLFLKENDPKKYSGPMPPDTEVLLQLAKGLEYIHQMGLVHRDIKPENILIWVNPQTNKVVMKWTDFGLSKSVDENGTFTMSKVKGTFNWLAPEILIFLNELGSTENEAKKRGTVKSDVFAEGLVFGYIISKGVHPFGTPNYQIPLNVRTKEPTNLPKNKKFHNIIIKMLVKESMERITSSDVVNLLMQITMSTSPSSFDSKLIIHHTKILGVGGFGTVYEGAWGGVKVAVKRILIWAAATTEKEEKVIKMLHHTNVIKLFHVEKDRDFKMFVLELCDASLDHLFLNENDPKKYRGPMPPQTEVLLQLAKGLEYIHQKGLVHRNIKPQNVLIWVNSQTKQVLMKWTDFGFSKRFEVNERGTFSMGGVRGAIDYFAPEILKLLDEASSSENEAQKRGTVKSDVFAEGLVFGYFLSGGVHPFGTTSHQIQINLRTNEPANLPKKKEFRDIILKMLDKKPNNRITSSDVFNLLINFTQTTVKKNSDLMSVSAYSAFSPFGGMLTIDRRKILGIGGFATVYEGAWGETKVAVKRFLIEKAASCEGEENALKQFDHENVVKLLHVEEDKNFKCFVLELCDASLDRIFLKENDPKKYNGPMPPETEVLLQLAKGLEYIHQMGLVHRDIKPENVLIWVNPQTNQVLMKWADFGYSKRVNERGTFTMSGVRGTYDYFAPEILALLDDESPPETDIQKRGTVKSDVFAEGLVFGYFLSGGIHPFGAQRDQIPLNVRTKEPTILPETKDIRKIMEKMLQKQPEKRIASSDVVNLLINTREIRTKKMFTLVAKKDPSVKEIKILIQEGVDINAKDKKGLTPLLQMAENKSGSGNALEIFSLLIQNGANVNSLDSKGKNALLLLCDNHQNHQKNLKEIMGLLMLSGLNVTPETVTLFKEKYHKENRDEIFCYCWINYIQMNQ